MAELKRERVIELDTINAYADKMRKEIPIAAVAIMGKIKASSIARSIGARISGGNVDRKKAKHGTSTLLTPAQRLRKKAEAVRRKDIGADPLSIDEQQWLSFDKKLHPEEYDSDDLDFDHTANGGSSDEEQEDNEDEESSDDSLDESSQARMDEKASGHGRKLRKRRRARIIANESKVEKQMRRTKGKGNSEGRVKRKKASAKRKLKMIVGGRKKVKRRGHKNSQNHVAADDYTQGELEQIMESKDAHLTKRDLKVKKLIAKFHDRRPENLPPDIGMIARKKKPKERTDEEQEFVVFDRIL